MPEPPRTAPTTLRDELHDFIDQIDEELARPGLHATVDTLPTELIPVVLKRMRELRAGITILPPELD